MHLKLKIQLLNLSVQVTKNYTMISLDVHYCPKSTEICFIDNSYHQDMVQDKIYYIQPRSYYHNLPLTEILNRFYNSAIGKQYRLNSVLKDAYKSYLNRLV